MDLADPSYGQKVVVSEKTLGASVAGLYVPSPEYAVVSTYNEAFYMVPHPMNFTTGEFLSPLPVPDSGGGIVLVNGFLYIGSQIMENPGLYIVHPGDNETAAQFYPTSLPPLTIAYAGENVSLEVDDEVPAVFELEPPFPNPFNPSTTIAFTIARNSRVTAAVYTAAGQKAATLAEGVFGAGRHLLVWRPNGMSSGVYFVRVSDGRKTETVKAVLVK